MDIMDNRLNNLFNIIRTLVLALYIFIFTPIFGLICIIATFLGDIKGYIGWPISRLWAFILLKIGNVTKIKLIGEEKIYKSKN